MKVKLTRGTAVRLPAGTVVDVPENEAKRLQAFGLAVEVKKPAAKKAPKK